MKVAQAYIQYPFIERMPVKELKAFKRVKSAFALPDYYQFFQKPADYPNGESIGIGQTGKTFLRPFFQC